MALVDDNGDDMVRGKILLLQPVNTKQVNLPDGRTFFARYERVSGKKLPANVTTTKARTVGPKRRLMPKIQPGSGSLRTVFNVEKKLFKPSYITKAFDIGSKAANLTIGQKMIEERIKQTPAIYNAGVKSIKNKNIKNILNSDLDDYAIKKAQKQLYN